ncbi:response regulator transcription factor [Sphingobacterium sp. HJSM2_6]|uniref:response regulator transcription factor n=1 Tax=Sphingobacterium sp. HJSM2_6 TaxID=3366264 RepID=UPI003BDF3E19
MKILIVEDEIEIARNIQEYLESENFKVESANNYHSAYHKLLQYQYDCVILDLMLPGGSGLELIKTIRKENKIQPILILSAKDSVEDKVKGLELGAEDYLSKPFHLAELLARVKAIIRRKSSAADFILRYKSLSLDLENRSVYVDQHNLILNRKEFDILYYLMLRPNRLLEKTTLIESVWGDHADQVDNLDFIYSQIKNIRKKLKEVNADVDLQSVYGVGYKLI